MPAQALYLKYRPRTFSEVEGQEHITRTLRNAVQRGRSAHAYLFTGPRGTGKTSTARILAKAVNCLTTGADKPCNDCAICRAINEERMLDLIEIDAASNTGVEDIRSLRDKVDFRPGEAQFKVYIIDEVHMLSTSAFNALLKTLEEPPPHVIFILATTDPQKIPATVLSRVQRFDFRRLTLAEIMTRLSHIAETETLSIEPGALELIARQASGAMRDAISLLDQLASYGGDEITLVQVQGLLGAGSQEAISRLIAALIAKDVSGGLGIISSTVDGGADPRQLAREVIEYLRALMLIQVGNANALTVTAETLAEMSENADRLPTERLLQSIRLFSQAAFELRSSATPTLPLEMAFVEATLGEAEPGVSRPTPRVAVPSVTSVPAVVKPTGGSKKAAARKVGESPAANPKSPSSVEGELTVEELRANWGQILARVRGYDKMTEAYLRSGAEPIRVDKELVVLGFPYELHVQRFEKEPKTKLMLEKALADIFQRKCIVKCILSPKKAKRKAVEEDPLIRAAVNQLGAEITEIHE